MRAARLRLRLLIHKIGVNRGGGGFGEEAHKLTTMTTPDSI
jgi:hypothetical protein